jgi:hypothetical protein
MVAQFGWRLHAISAGYGLGGPGDRRILRKKADLRKEVTNIAMSVHP